MSATATCIALLEILVEGDGAAGDGGGRHSSVASDGDV